MYAPASVNIDNTLDVGGECGRLADCPRLVGLGAQKYLGDVRLCSLDSPVLAYAPTLVGLCALMIAFGRMFDSALKAFGLFIACPLSSVTLLKHMRIVWPLLSNILVMPQ